MRRCGAAASLQDEDALPSGERRGGQVAGDERPYSPAIAEQLRKRFGDDLLCIINETIG